ncbi:MAG: hypothetical protein V1892_02385 [bacterium]
MEINKKDIEENRYWAALSYLWILFLFPLIFRKKSHFAQFHAKQGLVLTLAWFVVWVLGAIPVLGWLIIIPLGNLILVILSVLGILNALAGKYWKIPYLHQYAEKIKL